MDTVVAESFFKTIKYEWLYRLKFTSFNQLFNAVSNYINWYNTKRLYATLAYRNPLEVELKLKGFIKKTT